MALNEPLAYLKDPVLRLLPDDPPESYLSLSPDEQAWRGRYFLMAYAFGLPEEYCWFQALADEPTHNIEVQRIVRQSDDAVIVEAVRTRQAEDAIESTEPLPEA